MTEDAYPGTIPFTTALNAGTGLQVTFWKSNKEPISDTADRD